MTEQASTAIVPREWENVSPAEIIESVVIGGDLSKLTPAQRVAYYARVCSELGLNPFTQPFAYLWLGRGDDRKLVLYAKRDATDQIRRNIGVNITGLDYPTMPEGLFGVTAHAQLGSRTDSATGIVSVMTYDGRNRLSGELLANAMMKAETKAKRRVTLSIAGLGLLDETEVGSIPDGEVVDVDEAGNIQTAPESTVSDAIAARVAAIRAQVAPITAEREAAEAEDAAWAKAAEPETEPTVAAVLAVAAAAADSLPVPEGLTKATDEPEDESEPVAAEPVRTATFEQFVGEVSRYDRDEVRATAARLFPDAHGFRTLSEAQLGELLDVLAAAHPAPEPETAPEESEEELLATVMSVDESAALTARCGERSPFSAAICDREPDHAGVHRSGENESW